MFHRHTFGRIDKDIHPSKTSPEVYLEGKDIRIISTEGNDGGNVTPETGNEVIFALPDTITNQPSIGRYVYADTVQIGGGTVAVRYNRNSTNTLVSNSYNIQLIGYAIIEDIIVLFSTDDAGQGQIWKWENNTLTLLYNNKLNFSIDYPIRDWVARVENENSYKIYFTDANNQLRVVNIVDEDLINRPPDYFNMVPAATFDPIELVSTNAGDGNFTTNMVQYTYTLYNVNGAESVSAPLSNLITLKNPSNDDIYSNSLTLNFLVDTNSIYTNYKIYRIEYTALYEEPTITIIKDASIETSSVTFTDDGILNLGGLSPEELIFSGTSGFVCKTLTSFKNRLIAGNIVEETFTVDYDARAYRFDDTGTARIDDDINGPTYFTDVYTTAIDEEHDCINPSNAANTNQDFRNNSANSNPLYNKYIYQSDGTTIGGQGPNISYKFVETNIPLPTALTNPGLNPSQIYNLPQYGNLYKSYKRGEVYRFGIRFHNRFGQTSFVKWIGDIKMPDQNTHPFVTDESGGFINVRPLHVQFTVKTNNLPDDIVGYEIVRVSRTAKDRTIIAQGLVTALMDAPDSQTWAGAPGPQGKMQPSYIFRGIHNNSLNKAAYGYSIEDGRVISDDQEWTDDSRAGTDDYIIRSKYLQFISPEVEFNDVDDEIPTSINVVGGLLEFNKFEREFENNTNSPVASTTNGHYDAIGDLNSANVLGRLIATKLGEIESQTICNVPVARSVFSDVTTDGEVTLSSGTSSTDIFQSIYMMDSSSNVRKLRSIVGKSIILDITDGSGLGIEKVVSNGGNEIFTPSSTRKYILVDLIKNVSNQYGGNTYNARLDNEYIPVVLSPVSNNTVIARSGDVFINMFNCQTKSARVNGTTITGDVTHKEQIIFPVETTINLDARNHLDYNSFNIIRDLSITFSDEKLYDYNPVYSMENDLVLAFPQPRNFNPVSVYTNRLIASETKINGETIDNWLNFKSFDFMDLEGSYGEINAIEEFNGTVFTFQDSAIARINLQPNVQVSGDSGVQVQLGLGQFLYSYDYLSTNSGTQNQFSVCKSNNGIYYLDTLNRKFKLLGQGDQYISDVKGMHSWFRTNLYRDELIIDNPFKTSGVSTMYNKDTMELILSIRTPSLSETLTYNELLNGFTSFHSYNSPMYVFFNGDMYSVDNSLTGVWKHNANTYWYYGQSYNPYITLISNGNPDKSKTFDYLIFDSQYDNPDDLDNLLTSVEAYNSYQETGVVPITSSNFKRRFREWRLTLPREQSSRNRILSHYAMITLTFKAGKYFSLSNVISAYTPSYV